MTPCSASSIRSRRRPCAALAALAEERTAAFHEILAPTVPLSRHIFKAPTRFYKTGVVFMAYLNGHQDHFVMVGGQESARSLVHLAELFRLADAAGLLRDPELAAARMNGHRITSSWSAARKARARSCTSPSCSALRTAAGLLRDPDLATARMRKVMAVRGVEGWTSVVGPGASAARMAAKRRWTRAAAMA